MNGTGPRRLDRQRAEQLLAGGAAASPPGRDPVADLLAAAAAPAREHELAGEEAALHAFRQAQLGPGPAPLARATRRSSLVQLLTSKVATITLVGALAGGAAIGLASAVLSPSGDTPGGGTPAPTPSVQVPASVPAPAATTPERNERPDADREVRPTAASAPPSAPPSATPAPLLPGLPDSLPSPPPVMVPQPVPSLPALPIVTPWDPLTTLE